MLNYPDIAARSSNGDHWDNVASAEIVARIAELETALDKANRYLQACRQAIGAEEGELLVEAIQRRFRGRFDHRIRQS